MIEVGDTEDKREIIIKYFKSERKSLKARRMVNLLRWKDYELRERIPSFNFQEMTKTLKVTRTSNDPVCRPSPPSRNAVKQPLLC